MDGTTARRDGTAHTPDGRARGTRAPSGGGPHRPADERRAQLLDAAVEILREQGLRGLTTRAVTARAGVTHGIFHYCFGSKQGLVRALLERELTGTLDSAWGAATAADDVRTALHQGLLAQLDRVRADPGRLVLLDELVRAARQDPDLEDPAAWEQTRYLTEIEARLDTWARTADLVWLAPTADVAALVLATADGTVRAWLVDRDDDRARRTVDAAAAAIGSLARPRP